MSSPYVGEIRMFAGNFNPNGWAFCNGALIPISENEVLFQLIGTTYGGDGVNTFALPDLRGRVPLHMGTGGGSSYVIGEPGGVETVTLTIGQIPAHSHMVNATNSNQVQVPAGNTFPAGSTPQSRNVYGPLGGTAVQMSSGMIAPTGGSQPHENRQPFLCINFIISLFGIFPSQG
jgi:microcystin-dependent protein